MRQSGTWHVAGGRFKTNKDQRTSASSDFGELSRAVEPSIVSSQLIIRNSQLETRNWAFDIRTSTFVLMVIMMLCCITCPVLARPTSTTDIARGLPVSGTFQNAKLITDGDTHTYGVVYDAQEKDNYVEIELNAKYYLRQIKVYFEDGAYPVSFSLESKLDAFTGFPIKKSLLPAIAPKEGSNKVVVVDLDNVPAKSLRINLNKGLARGNTIRIAEIEVYANMDIWPEAVPEQPKILTDTEALVTLKSNLDLTGTITIEENGRVVQKVPTGVFTRDHAVFIHDLLPGHYYSSQMSFMDFHGNMASSPKMMFTTRSKDLLLKIPVEGTFTAFQPDDPNFVKPEGNPLIRVNDGDDSYFTSMVTSREPDNEDQYLVFDLGRPQALNTLFIFWRALAYSKDYRIEVSNDAEKWTTILQGLDAEKGSFCYSSRGDPMLVSQHDLQGAQAQYLRIFLKKGSPYVARDPKWKFVQIMEVKLF